MVIYHDAMSVLARLDKYFTMKPGSMGHPNIVPGCYVEENVAGERHTSLG